MPFDAIYSDADLMWENFGRYVRGTYAQNPRHAKSIEKWLWDLNERRRRNKKLRLAFVELEHEVTRRRFKAYRLNRQVYFSRDPAVLTLPHPRSSSDPIGEIYPDRRVGVYLHDFGYDRYFFNSCTQRLRLMKPKTKAQLSMDELDSELEPYARSVRYALKRAINIPSLPGDKANDLETWQLRLQRGDHEGWHQDNDKGPANAWARVLVHPLIRTGTEYLLEGNAATAEYIPGTDESALMCPIGAVSSHIAVSANSANTDSWGIVHRGVPNRWGRAVLIKVDGSKSSDWSPLRDDKSPWRSVKAVCAL